jgi:hypothetical protein
VFRCGDGGSNRQDIDNLCYTEELPLVEMLLACELFHVGVRNTLSGLSISESVSQHRVRVCIQKFPEWSPGARTANGTDLCH